MRKQIVVRITYDSTGPTMDATVKETLNRAAQNLAGQRMTTWARLRAQVGDPEPVFGDAA